MPADLLLLAVVLLGPWLLYRATVAAAEWRLAWRPPARAWLEVSVPAAADVTATDAMTFWWARAVHAARGSRLRGRGQIDLMHVLTGQDGGAQPTLRTYVGGDPVMIDGLRRELAQQFAEAATIRRVDDPLAVAAEAVRDRERARMPQWLRGADA